MLVEICEAVLLCLLILGALCDLRSFILPDWLTAGTALCGLVIVLVIQGFSVALAAHLGLAAVTFLICFLLYRWNAIGGGDGKWLAAIGLWIGPNLAFGRFLIFMSLAGGVLSLLVLLVARFRPGYGRDRGSLHVPYGAAIACGGLDFWLRQSSLGRQVWAMLAS